jgi:gluconolactonase
MNKSWLCLALLLPLLAGCAPQNNAAKTFERLDPAFDSLLLPDSELELVATGFVFTEGPVYRPDGLLLFSDIPANAIYKWSPQMGASVYRRPAGYDGPPAPEGAYIGPNGLTLDREGRLVICEHGNRRVTRLEKDGSITVLADRYQGKRLNSPNDAVYKSDGGLYFTDPPYGLPKQDEDPAKELKFNGVYRLNPDGTLLLLTSELSRPNGLAFSPDEKVLYVANSDPARKIWMRYEVKADGTLGAGSVFFDATSRQEDGLPDGMKVDTNGNLYCTGPGGIWVFSPQGKHLGTIHPPQTPSNLAWGKYANTHAQSPLAKGEKADTLYITARTAIYRVRLAASGLVP